MIKSPFRYPGGKTRAVKILKNYVPADVPVMSPFIGGGSFELYLASKGCEVIAYDAFKPLVSAWQLVLSNPKLMSSLVAMFYPLDKAEFYRLQKYIVKTNNPILQGVLFYVLNRASFSGTTLSGGMSRNHPRFTMRQVNKLDEYGIENLTVECGSFETTIPTHPDHWLYCDPPYMIASHLYGSRGNLHKDFDHLALHKLLTGRDNWLLCYNNYPKILDMYSDYEILYPDWQYGMSNDKNSREVLIVNSKRLP